MGRDSSSAPTEAKRKSKGKINVVKPVVPPAKALSKETIDSDDDDDGNPAEEKVADDVDDGTDGASEPDSEDLEGVTPRKRPREPAAINGGKGVAPKANRFSNYTPPEGMIPLEITSEMSTSVFEWEALSRKSGAEVWAIRVPGDLKHSRLSGLTVNLLSRSGSRPKVSGSLKTKHQQYNLVVAGEVETPATVVDAEGRNPTANQPGLKDALTMDIDPAEQKLRGEGGEEMRGGMRLLLPKAKAGGRLFISPVPVTRHLLLTPEELPHPSPKTADIDDPPIPSFLSTAATTIPNGLPKREQPTHLLKFRNAAYGAATPGPSAANKGESMHLDTVLPISQPSQASNIEGKKEKKEKRRKSEAGTDSPKKSKKAKL